MPDRTATVFVYGTLTDPARVDRVLDDWRFDDDAVLTGAHRVEGRYPTLAPGGEVTGRLLVTSELPTLDTHERVTDGLYVRVPVPLVDGGDCWCYVGDPDRLDAPATWPGEGDLAERVRASLEAAGATVRRRQLDQGHGARQTGRD